ncbi:hydroxypyruvate isomerase family protein [Rhizosphaericola mali]|uniref:TIM barrel protein n=1 Tax=Rhizosphaericola mali TaxID=2545455 RepID=A0A5P2GB87_9BACT|nr:TIM barrel protein [Rhizosphaericola mali]QES90473.1 TIM barrel protein [Rhizosphaericola mali]
MNNRREVVKNLLVGTTGLLISDKLFSKMKMNNEQMSGWKGNIHHSACRWCFSDIELEPLCKNFNQLGIKAMDLVGPKDWPILKKYNLDSSMCNGAEISLTEGFADKKYHEILIKNYTEHIDLVAKAGYKNLICFSGSRRGMDDETGWKNCVEGLQKLMPIAEKKGVTLVMELLNSKLNHKDYMCDRTWWGAELCKRLGSENFKLLFDIYHMQIDEGDIIQNIRDFHPYINHYHTAGVPGRHEIDATQELNYPAIMKAILATGFDGYVAQEFIPTKKDQMKALKECVSICDI